MIIATADANLRNVCQPNAHALVFRAALLVLVSRSVPLSLAPKSSQLTTGSHQTLGFTAVCVACYQ